MTPEEKVFESPDQETPIVEPVSKMQSPSSFHITDAGPSSTEAVKVEAAASILEMNEKALVAFNNDEIEKAFLNFKKC